MKSFQQFISESINIAGDFNGNLYMNSPQQETTSESFIADVVWEGKLYRLEIEGQIAEQLQSEYPGAIVHNIYPSTNSSITVKNSQRYRPERFSWSD